MNPKSSCIAQKRPMWGFLDLRPWTQICTKSHLHITVILSTRIPLLVWYSTYGTVHTLQDKYRHGSERRLVDKSVEIEQLHHQGASQYLPPTRQFFFHICIVTQLPFWIFFLNFLEIVKFPYIPCRAFRTPAAGMQTQSRCGRFRPLQKILC